MRREESAAIALRGVQSQKIFIWNELRPAHAKPQQIETTRTEHLHVRLDRFELNLQQQPSMARYLLHLVYLGLFCSELRLKVRPHSQKFFSFLPLPSILIATVLRLALHDALGQVEVLPINFKLNVHIHTLRR